ncbi:MAG: hypothetical protein WA901_11670 [Phormidesmis sp.]
MTKQIKIGATGVIFGAIALQIWQLLLPLPSFLQPLAKITLFVLALHALEGAIAAVLIGAYKFGKAEKVSSEASALLVDHLPDSAPMAVVKAGLYVFFVGTVGLKEVIEGTRKQPVES